MAEEKLGFVTMGAAAGAAEVETIGVGMLGYAFMGKAHSNAYKTLPYMAFPPPYLPELVAIAGRDEGAVAEAAGRYGFEGYVTDWKQLVADDRVQLFDNSGPNNLHAEPSIAAAEAGKHVICEKPLGRNAEEAHETWRRVDAAGVKHLCAFNYRFVPAIRLARQMIEAGDLGELTHFRGSYLQEWGVVDDEVWRFDKALAGSGALGDLGAHVIDLARYLVGEIESVAATTATFKPGREVDDAFESVVTFEGGAVGHDRGHALCHRAQERAHLRDQRLQGLARLRPRAAERAPAARGRLGPGRVGAGLPYRAGLRGRPPVLGVVVAARPHDRLGAHLRARDPPPAERHSGRRRRGSSRGDVRGRLPLRRGLRRGAAVGGVGGAGGRRVSGRLSSSRRRKRDRVTNRATQPRRIRDRVAA